MSLPVNIESCIDDDTIGSLNIDFHPYFDDMGKTSCRRGIGMVSKMKS